MVDPTAAESQAERDERLRHGSSFGAAAAAYAEHRPGYAEAAVRWALEPVRAREPRGASPGGRPPQTPPRGLSPGGRPPQTPPRGLSPGGRPPLRVLDLGAGTGKLTATLAGLQAEVTAVEPDPDMLAELRRNLSSVRSLPGSAEEIPLPDGSVDAVLVGQAMHWFDLDRALPEIARVLTPGGVLAALWNVDDDRVSWVADLAELAKRKSSVTLTRWRDGVARSRQEHLLEAGSDLFDAAEVGEFGHGQPRTADSLVATTATHSHLLVMEPAGRASLLAQVRDFLHARPETSAGEFVLPLVTAVLRARRKKVDGPLYQ